MSCTVELPAPSLLNLSNCLVTLCALTFEAVPKVSWTQSSLLGFSMIPSANMGLIEPVIFLWCFLWVILTRDLASRVGRGHLALDGHCQP